MIKSLIAALIINYAISAIWYIAEYKQFGELQWNRKCDNIVSTLYLIALWIAFGKWFK